MEHLNAVDHALATAVAEGIGVAAPAQETRPNHGRSSPALSQADQPGGAETRKVAVLAADGVDAATLTPVLDALREQGAICEVLAPHDGDLQAEGGTLAADRALTTMASVLYDAVLVAGGEQSAQALQGNGEAVHYVAEAYKHAKPLGAIGDGHPAARGGRATGVRLGDGGDDVVEDAGVVTAANGDAELFARAFAAAVAAHRHFDRELEAVAA